jgi:phosphate transport system substrate-binding protein
MKFSSWCAVSATVVGIGCLGALSDGSASAETLKIRGSAGLAAEVIGRYQDRIEELTGHKLNVIANSVDLGLLALLTGEADLAMISAPLDRIVASLRKSRPDLPFHLLREFHVAQGRVAFLVNPDNPVRSVSLAKLTQILSGQIGNWRELGGPDLPIHVISLRGGGMKRTIEEALLDGQRMTPRSEIIVEIAQEVAQTVAQDRGAMGFAPPRLATLYNLPELKTKALVTQSYSFVTLNKPTDAMRAVIAATRSIVFEEEP